MFSRAAGSRKNDEIFLLLHDIEPPKTHDMQILTEMCVEINQSFNCIYEDAVALTNYAVSFRYPTELGLVESDAVSAIKQAKKIMEHVKNFI